MRKWKGKEKWNFAKDKSKFLFLSFFPSQKYVCNFGQYFLLILPPKSRSQNKPFSKCTKRNIISVLSSSFKQLAQRYHAIFKLYLFFIVMQIVTNKLLLMKRCFLLLIFIFDKTNNELSLKGKAEHKSLVLGQTY